MLEELFLFTKLKNESFHLELKRCCLNQILKQTIFSYFDEWTARGLEPDIRITDQLLYIHANESGIRRMLQNVIKNALDHGSNGIGISLEEKDEQYLLQIWNTVLDPQNVDPNKVFERFYKADEARSRTSSGLGLSIAQRNLQNRCMQGYGQNWMAVFFILKLPFRGQSEKTNFINRTISDELEIVR